MAEINKKQLAFTTKYVMKNKSLIVYVGHDMDGDWHFLSAEENLTMSDTMLVAIADIIEVEPGIESILSLPVGHEARRTSPGMEWIILAKP